MKIVDYFMATISVIGAIGAISILIISYLFALSNYKNDRKIDNNSNGFDRS